MSKGFGDALRPMKGDVSELVEGGRLAPLFCRLARDYFTGVVYAEREDSGAVFSFRDGRAVFVEDLGDGQTIPDMLLERGLVNAQQYAEIATSVIDSLADNEDVAFCEHAVRLRVLTQAQVDSELERRVRGRVIQAIGWQSCRIELDSDPDALAGILEYPQELGPLVHMGVRTFYDEERVRSALGLEGALYARLTRPLPEVAGFFQLEGEELSLLSDLCGDLEVASAIEQSSADSLEAWQLLGSLALANLIELSGAPLSPVGSSGVRSTQALTGSYASRGGVREERVGSASQARMPVAREERVAPGSQPRMPSTREQQVRPGSQARMPAAREERGVPGSQGRMPATREQQAARPGSQARMPVAREERAAPRSRPQMPATRAEQARVTGPTTGQSTRYSSATMQAVRDEQISQPPRPSSQRLPAATGTPAHNAATRAPRASQGEAPPVQPAAAPPPRQRRRPRKLSTALKLLDRELKQLRPLTPVEVTPAAAAPAKGHIEQLRRMREAARSQQKPQPAEPAAPLSGADFFRSAQEAMREQKFAKACESMRKACEAEPKNEIYSMYCLWTEFRSNAVGDDGVNKLRLILREKISDDDHKAFAYYALGHIALFDKKDDAAEKFFRKAVELDKNNKDAQRHLRVTELRKKTAEQDKGNKIFGIEIKSKKS